MVTKTWNGATDSFSNGNDWSPLGVPQPGDTAVIATGTVLASNLTLAGLSVVVQSSAAAGGELDLIDSTLVGTTSLTVNNPNAYGTGVAPAVLFQGRNVNSGTIVLSGTVLNLRFAADSGNVAGALVNTGTINLVGASPQVNTNGYAGAVFENDGTINVTNPVAGNFESPVFNVGVSGTGTINLATRGKIDLRQGTSAGQSLVFQGGVNGASVAQIENVGALNATIRGFVAGNTILVANTPYDSATYVGNGAGGSLNLFSQGTLQGTLRFAGLYSINSFTFNFTPLGNGSSNLVIGTNVQNTTSGSATPSTAAGPVYRFFDKNTGTHFFTSDLTERDNTRGLSNYVQEPNDFGAVAPSDPNAIAVYRFFDTRYGTHFFTANVAERDNVIATRSDLIYEPNSTFYEHATQQAGDAPVYRFFDTQFGTHFYTGDAAEAASTSALLIAGSGRPAYIAEVNNFFAPTGSFT